MGKGRERREKEKDKRRDEKAARVNGAKHAVAAAPARKPASRPKPKGVRWVNPYLTVRSVEASLAWYEKAFGFKTSYKLPGADGKPIHAEMRHKKSVVMIGAESAEGRTRTPAKDGGAVSLYCYCEDVDALAASAKTAGAKIVEEPQDQFWGDRTCFLVDPDGHQWMFATHKFEVEPDALSALPGAEVGGAASDDESAEDAADDDDEDDDEAAAVAPAEASGSVEPKPS